MAITLNSQGWGYIEIPAVPDGLKAPSGESGATEGLEPAPDDGCDFSVSTPAFEEPLVDIESDYACPSPDSEDARHRDMLYQHEKTAKESIAEHTTSARGETASSAAQSGEAIRCGSMAHGTVRPRCDAPARTEGVTASLQHTFRQQEAEKADQDRLARQQDEASFARNEAQRAARFAQRDAELAHKIQQGERDLEARGKQRTALLSLAERIGIDPKHNPEAHSLIVKSTRYTTMSEREAKEVARKLQRMADEARSADQVSQESERRRKAADKNGANTKYWHLAEALVPSMVEFGRKHGVPRDEVISIVHAKYKVWERDVKNTINIENEISSVAQQCKKIQRDQQGRRANEGATNSDGNKGTSDMPPVPSGAAGDRPNSGRATTVSPPGPQGSGAGNGGDDPEKPGGDPYAKKKPSDGVPSPKAPPAPPPPPPPGRLGGGARPGGWSKPEDALAIKAHQGPAYPYYSSFTIALEKLGIADYHDIKDEETFLSVWREVGQNMRAKNIDEDRIKEIVTSFDAMANEWSSYKKSDATEVFRGDTLNVRGSYGWLNDFIEATEKDAGAMSIDLDLEVKCSTMMSTSSDPEMGYVKPKTVMWHFKLPEGHQGVCEGIYGEAETTFPLYNRMHIDALHRLPAGQAYLGDAKRFGTQHRYVIEATMLPPLPR